MGNNDKRKDIKDILDELGIDASSLSEDEVKKKLHQQETRWQQQFVADPEKASAKLNLVKEAEKLFKEAASRSKDESRNTGSARHYAETSTINSERLKKYKELCRQAKEFLDKGENDLAQNCIDEAASYKECISSDIAFYVDAAEIYMANKSFDSAINIVNQGIRVFNDNCDLYYVKGLICTIKNDQEYYEKSGKDNQDLLSQAIQCFKKSVELARNSGDKLTEGQATGTLAYCLFLQGKTDVKYLRQMANYALNSGASTEYAKKVLDFINRYETELAKKQEEAARKAAYKQAMLSEEIKSSSKYRVKVANFKPFKTPMLEGEVVGGIFLDCVVNAALKCGLPVKTRNGIIGGMYRDFYQAKNYIEYKYRGFLFCGDDEYVWYFGDNIEIYYANDNYLYLDFTRDHLCRDYSNNELAIEILEEAIKAGLVYENTFIEPIEIIEIDNDAYNPILDPIYREAINKYDNELAKLLNNQSTDFQPIKKTFAQLGYYKDSNKYYVSCCKCAIEEEYRFAINRYNEELNKLRSNQSTDFYPIKSIFAKLKKYKQSEYYNDLCEKCYIEEVYRESVIKTKTAKTKAEYISVIDKLYKYIDYRNSREILYACVRTIRALDNETAKKLDRNICSVQEMQVLIKYIGHRNKFKPILKKEEQVKKAKEEIEVIKKNRNKIDNWDFINRWKNDREIKDKKKFISSCEKEIKQFCAKNGYGSFEDAKKESFNINKEIVDITFPFIIPDETRLFYFSYDVLNLIIDEEVFRIVKTNYPNCMKLINKFEHQITGAHYDKNSNYIRLCREYDGESESKSGCYVATAVYGSYDCPEVWTLRRFRDYSLAKNWFGRLFIALYYLFSPTVVKCFGHANWFNKLWRPRLDRFVTKLNNRGYANTPYKDKAWHK